MPQMGESVTEGTILEWHVAEGQEVAEGDTVVEVSTDKIDAEVPAPASGVVTKILAQPDDTVEVGQALAQIDPNGARSDNGASADPSPLKESEGLVMGGGEGDEDLGDDAAGADSPQPGVTETPTPEDAHLPADPAAPGRIPAEPGSPVADAPSEEAGGTSVFEARVRLDTPNEVRYFQNGGILHRVLRDLRSA
jgi:pyruvate/2-oxoglutarate dehydrogenase complex dihydrolipoamide acyltransferase (E2) component